MLHRMDYREQPPAPGLTHLVRTGWTLACGAAASETIEHQAVPGGCIELIWRLSGHSFWRSEQPGAFVCGLLSRPAPLRFSGDARFAALRLWPWAARPLGLLEVPRLIDDWAPLPGHFAAPERVLAMLATAPKDPIAEAIIGAQSVAQIVERASLAPRRLQRWFTAEIGVPPRQYLRLMRFQEALGGIQADGDSLAAHAADHGYADQAHMAREFRTLARAPARALRSKAKGPFV